uniref:Uncharacterized protein n=1 Tax=Ditylenchus dipsaci TaxID=166011 RepID=A0A915DGN3_9BILA
ESCLNKFVFNFGQISQILLLPMDYFFAYRATHSPYIHTKGSLCNSKPITMQSVVCGTLILVDLYTGKWVQFLKDKDAVDVTLGEGDVLTVLSKDGSVAVHKPLTGGRGRTSGHVYGQWSASINDIVQSLKTTYPNHIHLNKVLDYITTTDSIALQPLTLKRLSQLWQLTRAEISMGNVSSPSLSSQSFHIHAPPQWVDSQHIHQHRTFAQHKRVGFLSMGAKDSEVASSKSYVLLGEEPGLSWSHVTFSLKYLASTAGAPDLQLTVLKRKSDQSSSSSSSSNPFHQPHIQTICWPLAVSDYMDGANQASHLQLNSSQLYSQESGTEKGQTFYLLVESLNNLSSEQLVMRQTAKLSYGSRSSFGCNSRYSAGSAVDRRMCLPPKLRKSLPQSKPQFKAPFSLSKISFSKAQQASKPSLSSTTKLRAQPDPKDGELDEGSLNSSFQWVEELTISIYKTPGLPRNARLQRVLLLKLPMLQNHILKTAAGLMPDGGSIPESVLREEYNLAQCQALDLLVWLCSHTTASIVNGLIEELVDSQPDEVVLLEKALLNGYINGPRSVAHKWNIVLFELIRLKTNMDDSVSTTKVEKAGSLQWLFALMVHVIRISSTTSMPDESLSTAVNDLLRQCTEVLSKVGKEWKNRWEGNQLQDKLVNKYKLAGLPFEQQMFDYPTQMLSIHSHFASCVTEPANLHEMAPSFPPYANSFGKSSANQQLALAKTYKYSKTGGSIDPQAGFTPPSVFSQFSMAVGVPPGPHSYNFPPPAIWTNQSPLLNQPGGFSAPPPHMVPMQLATTSSSSTNFTPNKMVLYFCNPENGEPIQPSTSLDSSMFPATSSFTTPNPYYVPAKAHPLSQSHPPSSSSVITYQPVGGVPQYLPSSQAFGDTIVADAKKYGSGANWFSSVARGSKQGSRAFGRDGSAATSQASATMCKEYAVVRVS